MDKKTHAIPADHELSDTISKIVNHGSHDPRHEKAMGYEGQNHDADSPTGSEGPTGGGGS